MGSINSHKVFTLGNIIKLCIENTHYTPEEKATKLESLQKKIAPFAYGADITINEEATQHVINIRKEINLLEKQFKKQKAPA